MSGLNSNLSGLLLKNKCKIIQYAMYSEKCINYHVFDKITYTGTVSLNEFEIFHMIVLVGSWRTLYFQDFFVIAD